MILEVLKEPHPVLSKKAEVVIDWQPIPQLVQDMLETMYHAKGIGLAAPQVGISKRLVVIDLQTNRKPSKIPYVLVNPVILKRKGIQISKEGCLSIPDCLYEVQRASDIEIMAQDKHGRSYRFKAQGLLANCIQHELDHLDGVLMSEVGKKIQ